ncbi:hypothetical protein U9M48_020883 [Paspalum notatum var. saurae]|uniref:MYB transcription factor n=1 Tax=Paspalum notatum var. saurae TaxID=547442 RepID=A0AAQ3WS64_PASNO
MGRVHPCCSEEKKVRKGLWSPEEDERLASHIARFGVSCWSSIPELAGLQRCGKSCRLRWMNYLRPDLKRGRFSQQEEGLIVALHKALGNSWSQIAARLPGRSDNEIKNFWNARMRKKLRQKEAAAAGSNRGRNNSAEDGRKTKPAPSVFDPFPSCQDHAAAGSSCDDSSAAGSFVVGDAVVATCPAAVADAEDDRNAAAAAEPGVTPPPMTTATATATSTSRACATDARASCDDGFLTAMVDDASFLFEDFYLHGDNDDGQISFWDAHAFS